MSDVEFDENEDQEVDFDAIVDEMARAYPHPVIPRRDVPIFTNKLISYKGQISLDNRGEGPPSFKCARQKAYPKALYCKWLKKKLRKDSARKTAGGYRTHRKNRN